MDREQRHSGDVLLAAVVAVALVGCSGGGAPTPAFSPSLATTDVPSAVRTAAPTGAIAPPRDAFKHPAPRLRSLGSVRSRSLALGRGSLSIGGGTVWQAGTDTGVRLVASGLYAVTRVEPGAVPIRLPGRILHPATSWLMPGGGGTGRFLSDRVFSVMPGDTAQRLLLSVLGEGEGAIVLADLDGREQARLPGHPGVVAVPVGAGAVAVLDGDRIALWRPNEGIPTWHRLPADAGMGEAIRGVGRRAVVFADSGSALLVDPASGQVITTWAAGPPEAIALAPDGARFAVSDGGPRGQIEVRDALSGAVRATHRQDSTTVAAIVWPTEGTLLALTAATGSGVVPGLSAMTVSNGARVPVELPFKEPALLENLDATVLVESLGGDFVAFPVEEER